MREKRNTLVIKSSFLISGTVKGQGRLTIKGGSGQKGSVDISLMEMPCNEKPRSKKYSGPGGIAESGDAR